MFWVVTREKGPIVEYSKDGKHMTLRTPIPKEVLGNYKVAVEGDTVTVQYRHSEENEERHEHAYSRTMRSFSNSFSQSVGRKIKSYDTRIEGENTLIVDVAFEDKEKKGS